MGWVVNGCVPDRTSRTGKAIGKKSFNFITVLNYLKTNDLSEKEINDLIQVMKDRKFIQTAVRTNAKGDRDVMEYLIEFWTRDQSPYLREMELKDHSSTNRHLQNMRNIIKSKWRPILEGKLLGEVTRDDVNKIFMAECTRKLSPKTIKAVLQAVTIPMKWAHLHDLTENNCYSGIISARSKTKKKTILTMEETRALFNAEWDNDRVKLACLVACFTGMRQGEILALQVRDIGTDHIFIRHSYSPYEGGLKTPKNGEEREIRIPPQLRDMLLNQAAFNPWGYDENSFIFYSTQASDKPMSPKRFRGEVYAMAEKLVTGLEEVEADKSGLIDWENNLEGREDSLKHGQKTLETEKKEYAEEVQKNKEAHELRDKISRRKEREAREGLEQLEEEKQNQEYARARASAHIHKGFDFLRKMKKIFEAKDEQANQKLDDALKIAQRAENLQNSLTSPYYNFADDIKFEDARLMAAKGDGQGLCYWFNCLGHKFGSWLHKAEYFVKTFWKKTPDEIINVGEDMKKNCCKNLGEYIEKGMKAKTINQIKETREIKEEIPQVRKKVRSRDDGWEW